MANAASDHIFILDTDGLVTDETVLIEAIRVIPTAGTDRATIANGLGDVIWDSGISGTALVPIESTIPFRSVSGMTVNVTGTPIVYVYGRLDR